MRMMKKKKKKGFKKIEHPKDNTKTYEYLSSASKRRETLSQILMLHKFISLIATYSILTNSIKSKKLLISK
jgi:hypothetical protein